MDNIITILRHGGIGVLATDTLYGLVGSAFNPTAVERIYQIKQRQPHKPLISLIADYNQLLAFGIEPSANPEGQPPATTIARAKAYFGDQLDFYLAGRPSGRPSKLVDLASRQVLRP